MNLYVAIFKEIINILYSISLIVDPVAIVGPPSFHTFLFEQTHLDENCEAQ